MLKQIAAILCLLGIPMLQLSYASPFPISLTQPATKSVSSTVSQARVGQSLVLATEVHQNSTNIPNYTIVFEVLDSQGLTDTVIWYDAKNQTGDTGIGLEWIPDKADTFELRCFAISDMAKPQVYSEENRSNVTIVSIN